MVVNCLGDWPEPGHTGDGSTVTLPVKVMRGLTMMRCAISLPVSVRHRIALNGSTPAYTGPMALKDRHKAIGMLIPLQKRICVQSTHTNIHSHTHVSFRVSATV